jgi:hypothetical protein
LNLRIITGSAVRAKHIAIARRKLRRIHAQNEEKDPMTKKIRGKRHKSPAADAAPGKRVDVSRSEMVEAVLPNDANTVGTMLGGRVMHLIDIAARWPLTAIPIATW